MAAHQALLSLRFSRQEHEWVAISFSNAWKWEVKVKSLSRVLLLATPWTAAYQAPPSMGFSRQEYWSGLPLPSPIGSNNSIPRYKPKRNENLYTNSIVHTGWKVETTHLSAEQIKKMYIHIMSCLTIKKEQSRDTCCNMNELLTHRWAKETSHTRPYIVILRWNVQNRQIRRDKK